MHAALTDTDIADRIRTGVRCDLCREPRRPAGTLCWDHHDELSRVLDPDYLGDRDRDRAASIPQLWARLDPTPTTTGLADRRAPGFASTPPCNIHIIAMRDHRSTSYPVVDVWYEPRLPGISSTPNLDQPHYEENSPPRAVEKVIGGLTAAIWDDIGVFGPLTAADHRTTQGVVEQCAWLHDHLHHLTAREDAADIQRDLTDLHTQLRHAAGDPPARPVAECTGWTRHPVTREKVECGHPLYLPPPQPGVVIDSTTPVLRCERCKRSYTKLMLLRLEIGAERQAS